MRKAWLCSGLAALLVAIPASADPIIDVGSHPLLGGTPGQSIRLWITGDGNLAGLNLFVQVGDGGPELAGYGVPAGTDGPAIARVNLQPVGGIFAGKGTQTDSNGIPQVAASTFDVAHGTVKAIGLLVELKMDTTGFNSGTWALLLKGVLPYSLLYGPYDTAGVAAGGKDLPISITNGSISIPGIANWNAASGAWSDSNCWTAGEPNASLRANVTNGGTATINQTGRSCALLTLGSALGQSGTVSMTGGALTSDIAYIGYKGTGTFTQSSGDHHVQQSLLIAEESNSSGAYAIQGGNLFAHEIAVGGSMAGKGGTGTFTISGGNAAVDGDLLIWAGSAAHLGAGTLTSLDGNRPYVDVENSGTLYVEDGVYCLGRLTGIGDTWTGKTVVKSGATLWVESMEQDSLVIEAGAEVHFAGENYELFMNLARANQSLVPEPGSLVLMGLGGIVLAKHRRRRGKIDP